MKKLYSRQLFLAEKSKRVTVLWVEKLIETLWEPREYRLLKCLGLCIKLGSCHCSLLKQGIERIVLVFRPRTSETQGSCRKSLMKTSLGEVRSQLINETHRVQHLNTPIYCVIYVLVLVYPTKWIRSSSSIYYKDIIITNNISSYVLLNNIQTCRVSSLELSLELSHFSTDQFKTARKIL